MSLLYWAGAVISTDSWVAVTGKNSSRSAWHMQLEWEINISHGRCHWSLWVVTTALPNLAWLIMWIAWVRLHPSAYLLSMWGADEGLSEHTLLQWAEPYAGTQGLRHTEVKEPFQAEGRGGLLESVVVRLSSELWHSLPLVQRWNVEQCRKGPL